MPMKPSYSPCRCICGTDYPGTASNRNPTRCPACGSTDRITRPRLAAMLQILEGRFADIPPIVRDWLVERRLIRATEPPRAPVVAPSRNRPAGRRFVLTETGENAIRGLESTAGKRVTTGYLSDSMRRI
jgi:hypothetical protein